LPDCANIFSDIEMLVFSSQRRFYWAKFKNKSANFFQITGVGQEEAPKKIFPPESP